MKTPMLTITSPHNPTIKLIRSLAEKKHRQEAGLFVAEGPKVLERARAEGWEPEYLLTTTHAEPWGKAALMRVDEKIMGAGQRPEQPARRASACSASAGATVKPEGVWVALEDMRDPGNLGTIIRTADAAGAAGVILAGQSCDPLSPDCVRATMGSIFAMPLVRLEQKPFLDLLRQWPGESVGTHLQGDRKLPPRLQGSHAARHGQRGQGPVGGGLRRLLHPRPHSR